MDVYVFLKRTEPCYLVARNLSDITDSGTVEQPLYDIMVNMVSDAHEPVVSLLKYADSSSSKAEFVLFQLDGENTGFCCRSHDSLAPEQAATRRRAWVRDSSFAINLVHQGRGTYVDTAGVKHEIKPGTVFFDCRIIPIARTLNLSGTMKAGWFCRQLCMCICERLVFVTLGVKLSSSTIQVRWLYCCMNSRVSRGDGYRGLAAWNEALMKIMRILTVVQQAVPQDEEWGRSRPEWYYRVVSLLRNDLANSVTLDDLAEKMSMSEQALRKGFKKIAGVSPIAYRNNRRVEWARAALLHKSVQQVADELGFIDGKHFATFFKKKVGISPREFQQKGREQI